MANKDSRSASEKLVSMLRGAPSAKGKGALDAPAKTNGNGSSTLPTKARGFRLFGGGRGAVGVDISPGKVCLVRARRTGNGFEVQAMKTVRFDVSLDVYSDEALTILRSVLDGFLSGVGKDNLWASMVTSTSDMQLVFIPKTAKKQFDNAVFWSAKREFDFDEANVVFDYEKRGEVVQKGVPKIGAMVYSAPKTDVQKRASLCARAGHPLTGLIMPSFSAQNIFRSLPGRTLSGGAAVLFVGWSWSRLEIFTQEGLVFNRVIKASMSGMEQSIDDALERRRAQRTTAADHPEPAPVEPAPPGETRGKRGGFRGRRRAGRASRLYLDARRR